MEITNSRDYTDNNTQHRNLRSNTNYKPNEIDNMSKNEKQMVTGKNGSPELSSPEKAAATTSSTSISTDTGSKDNLATDTGHRTGESNPTVAHTKESSAVL